MKPLTDYRDGDTITTEAYRALVGAPDLTKLPSDEFDHETAFQWWLRDASMARSWLYFHPGDGKRQDPGFPDTVLVQAPHLCFAELKMPGNTPSAAQRIWLDDAARVAFGCRWLSVCVWYPEHCDAIVAYLETPTTMPPGIWVPA